MPALRFSRKYQEFPGCIAETYIRSKGGRGEEKRFQLQTESCRKARIGVGWDGRWVVEKRPVRGRPAQLHRA